MDLASLAKNASRRLLALVVALPPLLAQTPSITPGGIVNAAGYPDAPGVEAITPCSLATLYGQNLAPPGTAVTSNGFPLPTGLGSPGSATEIHIAGYGAAPLLFASPNQVNFQVPCELTAGTYQVTAVVSGVASAPAAVQVARTHPRYFTWSDATLDPQRPFAFSVSQQRAGEAAAISFVNPARPGDTIVAYLTGAEPNSAIRTGQAVPVAGGPFASPTSVQVFLGPRAAEMVYGVYHSPYYAGLQQTAFKVPAGLADGFYLVRMQYTDGTGRGGNRAAPRPWRGFRRQPSGRRPAPVPGRCVLQRGQWGAHYGAFLDLCGQLLRPGPRRRYHGHHHPRRGRDRTGRFALFEFRPHLPVAE